MAGPSPADAAEDLQTRADTRQRLIDVAVDLFTRFSFAGTSLQMIADELGFTKAAIYHHFRTREQLLDAVVAPMLEQLTVVIDAAEQLRGVHARADYLLTGYAQLAVDNRVVSVLAADPSVAQMLRTHREWDALIERQMALLVALEPGPAGMVKAAVALAGIAGASGPTFVNLDRDALREHLVDAGRRALGLRTPRRGPSAKS
ncbi:TetR/AcrR family transcriptional regulator [Mycolicibacterium mengxianglii]|uniref:TetR/AcrR family transcriptional regulator n=1 Tax=Mycolicibacterium mengxianglii TaxID=2736649 RepID=UPI0018D0DF10|nr:TetR/AcrR family transcriptional regulator [Mycolicibacterium mengxianglii]